MPELHIPFSPLKWGDNLDLLSDERKMELAQRLWAWKPEMATKKQPGPFVNVQLNGLEVFWLAICAEAGENGNIPATEAYLRQAVATTGDWLGEFPRLYLQGANLGGAHLERANLSNAHLEEVKLGLAHLEEAFLRDTQLKGADLGLAHLEGADLRDAQMEGAILAFAQLKGADFEGAKLERALFRGAHLEGATLCDTQLEGATLSLAQLEGANLDGATLTQADLRQAALDKKTNLTDAILTDIRLDGAILDGANLSVVDWSLVPRLQDERLAHQAMFPADYRDEKVRGKWKSHTERAAEYQAAARAYRRLVVALQANGMSEEAAGYAYRAQVMQRRVYRFSGWRSWGRWLFSGFLDLLAGYGYKPERSLIAYLLVIFSFAATFFTLGRVVGPSLSPLGALIFSITSFHGRGFFPGGIALDDPITVTAAAEAIVGLLIEISFIATFTQRFFGSK